MTQKDLENGMRAEERCCGGQMRGRMTNWRNGVACLILLDLLFRFELMGRCVYLRASMISSYINANAMER